MTNGTRPRGLRCNAALTEDLNAPLPLLPTLLLAALTGCGGGGGGGGGAPAPTPTPAPASVNGAGTVAVTPANSSTGIKQSAAVVKATANVTAGVFGSSILSSYVCGGTNIPADTSLAGLELTITPKSGNLPPYGSACKVTGQATIAGQNGGNATTVNWETSFTIEAEPKLVYTDKVYATWGLGAQPYSVTRNADGSFTVAKVENVSKWQTGAYPVSACAMYRFPLPSGHVLTECKVVGDGSKVHVFAINPVTQTLDEYTGTLPEPTTGPNWIYTQPLDPSDPTSGARAVTAEGLYYTTAYNTWTLLFKSNAGAESTVKAGVFAIDSDIKNIMAYTNTEAFRTWWPPTFVPQGTKVYLDARTAPIGAVANATHPGQTDSGLLPPECKQTQDACWQEATRNGTIKYVQTGGIDPPTGLPVVWAFYRTVSQVLFPGQSKVLYCERPILAKDGTYGAPVSVEDRCAQAPEVAISIQGTAEGVLVEQSVNGLKTCYRRKYSGGGWVFAASACN